MKAYALLFLVSLLAGCDAGVQRGQYVVGSSGEEALAGGRGSIATFAGSAATDLSAPNRLLVAVIFLGQDFTTHEYSHLTSLSSLHVITPVDEFDLTWDRYSECVCIQGSTFDRSAGNIFIVRFDGNKTIAKQIPRTVESVDVATILAATKNAVPDDSAVGVLEPYPID